MCATTQQRFERVRVGRRRDVVALDLALHEQTTESGLRDDGEDERRDESAGHDRVHQVPERQLEHVERVVVAEERVVDPPGDGVQGRLDGEPL